MTATVRPYAFWSPAAEQIRADDEACQLLIGPKGTGTAAAVEFTVGFPSRASTRDPDTLRAFGDAFHRWANTLEAELAKPPVGQTGLAL